MNDEDPIGCARILVWLVVGALSGATLGLLLSLAGLMG
jgi:hypothetical protein